MKEITKQLNLIKKKWGVDAFDDITKFIFKLYRKIEDLTKMFAGKFKKMETSLFIN